MKRKLFLVALYACIGCLAIVMAILADGRWWRLQRLGQVPENVDRSTREGESLWRTAEWTTWWGKKIEPGEFWRNRVIWNDDSAQDASHRRGRAYPPIPEHLTNLTAGFPVSSRSHKDIVPGPWSGGPEGGRVIPYHYSDAEGAYWNWFWRTKPKPPATLEREQLEVAKDILQMRQRLMVSGIDLHDGIRAQEGKRSEEIQKSRAKEIGVPAEALTEEALFWAYVLKQRQEYAKEQAQGAQWKAQQPEIAERFLGRFLDRLLVDKKFITEPLTEEQVKAANAWKIAYLRRLRREKTDQSYIKAYLAAWKLDPAKVFQDEPGK